MKPQLVLFFDGVCGLCSMWVDFVMKYDRNKKFMFSPLQSDFAKNELKNDYTENFSTLVLRRNDQIYTKSDAVLKIAFELGGVWKMATMGYLIPRRFRNSLYDFVARNRYKWFGQKESCRLPTPDEKSRFIL